MDNDTAPASTSSLITLAKLSELVRVPKQSLYRYATFGFTVCGETFHLKHSWRGNAILSSVEAYADWNNAVEIARDARRELCVARYKARCIGRPSGRPRRVDPNEHEANVAKAECRLRELGC